MLPGSFSRGALGAYFLGDTVYSDTLAPRITVTGCHAVVRDGHGSPSSGKSPASPPDMQVGESPQARLQKIWRAADPSMLSTSSLRKEAPGPSLTALLHRTMPKRIHHARHLPHETRQIRIPGVTKGASRDSILGHRFMAASCHYALTRVAWLVEVAFPVGSHSASKNSSVATLS